MSLAGACGGGKKGDTTPVDPAVGGEEGGDPCAAPDPCAGGDEGAVDPCAGDPCGAVDPCAGGDEGGDPCAGDGW